MCGGKTKLYFEFAASSKKDVCQQFPILNVLHDQNFSCGNRSQQHNIAFEGEDHQDSCNVFDALSKRAFDGQKITDRDVQDALRKVFKAEEAQIMILKSPDPFIHTRQSLSVMGRIASQTIRQLSSESEDTHILQTYTPILLSGDTGTGKTYLLYKYLELLRSSGALQCLDHKDSIFTLSARFLRSNVVNLGENIKASMTEVHRHLSPDDPRKACSFILDEVSPPPLKSLLVPPCVFSTNPQLLEYEGRLKYFLLKL